MNNFGHRIKQLRLEHGMTQDELAFMLGVSRSTISNYENNNMKPKAKNLLTIAAVFDVPISRLFLEEAEHTLPSDIFEDGTDTVHHSYIDEDGTVVLHIKDSLISASDYTKKYFRVLDSGTLYFTQRISEAVPGTKLFASIKGKVCGIFAYSIKQKQHCFSHSSQENYIFDTLDNIEIISMVIESE